MNNNSKVFVLEVKEPCSFSRTSNGFKIKHKVEDGDFYHGYYYFNILAFVSAVVGVILGQFFSEGTGLLFLFFYILAFFSVFLNVIHNNIINTYTFTVDQNGISIKSISNKYFIESSNVKNCWFSHTSKMVDKLDLDINTRPVDNGSFFYNNHRGLFRDLLYESDMRRVRNTDMFGNVKELKESNNIFFELEKSIFDISSRGNNIILNTGISFDMPEEARFIEREFERVLGIPDILVESEYDWFIKNKIRNLNANQSNFQN